MKFSQKFDSDSQYNLKNQNNLNNFKKIQF